MKSLKFLSLIMICATSVLALILPAFGLAPFPIHTEILNSIREPKSEGIVNANTDTANNLIPAGLPISGSSQPPPMHNGIPTSSTNSVLPTGNSNQNSYSQVGTNLPIPQIANRADLSPSLTESMVADASANFLDKNQPGISELTSTKKIGMGLWLLLGPIWIISLFVWTIAPTPSPTKK